MATFTFDSTGKIVESISDDPTSVVFPSQVTTIRNETLNGKHTEEISFEEGSQLTTLEESCFRDSSNLIKVDLTNCKFLPQLSLWCFRDCKELVTVLLPEYGVFTTVSEGSFTYCSSLKTIHIPSTVKILDDCRRSAGGLFDLCDKLEVVHFDLDSCLEKLGSCTFYNCQAIKEIILPRSLKSIGESAFYGCSNLKQVYVPESVKSIKGSAFPNAQSIKLAYCETFLVKKLLIKAGISKTCIKVRHAKTCNYKRHQISFTYSFMLFIA